MSSPSMLIALALTSGTLHASPVLTAQFAGNYTVGTFASGLSYPVGMTKLSDGSYLIGETLPPSGLSSSLYAYYNGTGQVVRITDTIHPGVADNAGTVIASGLPGAVTGVLNLNNGLIAVSTVVNNNSGVYDFNAADLTFFHAAANPTDAYTNVGSVHFAYPSGGAAAALLPTVAATGSNQFKIYFGLNAQGNDGTPGPNIQVSGLISGQLPGGSLDSMTVQTTGGTPNVTAITNLATGIRNTSRPVVDSAGNVYFGDNGYDNASNVPVSADELNILPASTVGIPSYGYPGSYTAVGTGVFVGGQGVPPLSAFQLMADGSLPSGISDLAFAPVNFANKCVFAGFHGDFITGGAGNSNDPVLCVNPDGTYSAFLAGGQSGLNHPDSLLATSNALFVANMFTGNFTPGTGEIDVITPNANTPDVATGFQCLLGLATVLTAARRRICGA